MAQFLIITEDSLSLQSSPILSINRRRLSKRNYIVLLRILSKFLFYRRISLQKDFITVAFLDAFRLECAIEYHLKNFDVLSRSVLAFRVYLDMAVRVPLPLPDCNAPVLFNLDTYKLSFYDEHYHDTADDDVFDLPY